MLYSEFFFYKWNEKQLTVHKKQRNIRVIPPIESHFNAEEVRRTDCTETFGEKYHYVLPKVPESAPDTSSSNDGEQQTTTTDMVNNLNDCVQNYYSSSSDEDEQSYSKHGSDTTTASLTDSQKKRYHQLVKVYGAAMYTYTVSWSWLRTI